MQCLQPVVGLFSRKDFRTLPLNVASSITEASLSFLPVIEMMYDWGMKYL
jgi:DNA-binding HxlR family transcriptional regulator